MADYTDSKAGIGEQFPQGAVETTWKRTEPLITPEKLKRRELFGIPLVSGIKDPITGKADVMTPDIIADFIDRAVSIVEIETGLTIFPTQIERKLPFDRQLYASYGFMRLEHRPVASVESLTISPSSNVDVFVVPTDWIEVGQLYQGQINIIPLTIALSANGMANVVAGAGGPALLSILNNHQWLSSYWKIFYTAGFKDGKVPKVVNDLIGTVAAIEILSMLAATNAKSASGSLSIDGMSQSQSNPGPDLFKPRIEDLEKKRDLLTRKLKSMFGTNLFVGEV